MTMDEWARRWNLPLQALQELVHVTCPAAAPAGEFATESGAQADIRLKSAYDGVHLWRNNSGALPNEAGVPVRFGLGNDSPQINKVFKSSDLIGVTPLTVQPSHVGRTLGVFTAVEVKEPGWDPRKKLDKRETAQANYLRTVSACGGIGLFATDYSQVKEHVEKFRY